MEWKRNKHKENNTILIETYSYEMFEGNLYENLSKRLSENGIILKPKSAKEIFDIIKKSANEEYESIITLFMTFITLMKSNNYTFTDLKQKNTTIKDEFQRDKNGLFIEIIKPIYENYQSHLAIRKELDFSDMINKATEFINKGVYNQKFDYVIIDEFQDISIGRYKLVKAIKEQNPECKLFCVGDDWQSIYRFSGSDITLFKNFEQYFGYTEKLKIETTYRFHNPLIKLSSDFILKNSNQAKKELKSNSLLKSTKYKIVYSITDNQDDTLELKQILDELIENGNDIFKKEIYLLGRYNFDINRIKNEDKIFSISEDIIQYQKTGQQNYLKATFMSVHKAKGLEADIVIILNCNSGKHGFPSEMSDDPILNILLSDADQFENGEERRLFYVAMTRAKEKVYFISDATYKSKFIAELEVETGEKSVKKCPLCLTSDLVKKSGTKNGKNWAFYGCSNYLYGCEYQEWVN
jgi:DNA helicase-4